MLQTRRRIILFARRMTLSLPQEFLAAREALARFCSSYGSRATLLESETAIRHTKEQLPEGLLPFMTIEEPCWPDVYAFDVSCTPPAVVVWSDHAIVERWEDIGSFLRWASHHKGEPVDPDQRP